MFDKRAVCLHAQVYDEYHVLSIVKFCIG